MEEELALSLPLQPAGTTSPGPVATHGHKEAEAGEWSNTAHLRQSVPRKEPSAIPCAHYMGAGLVTVKDFSHVCVLPSEATQA